MRAGIVDLAAQFGLPERRPRRAGAPPDIGELPGQPMRIAFYAPLKPPDHPVPSGDRRIARLFIEALRRAGHEPFARLPAAQLRRRRRPAAPGAGSPRSGERTAERAGAPLARPAAGAAPELWFTYHLYYKAPDWLGPAVSAALGIPYVVAEASYAAETRRRRLGRSAIAPSPARCAAPMRCSGSTRPTAHACCRCLPMPGAGCALPPFLDAAPTRGVRPHAGRRPAPADRGGDDATGRQACLLPPARRGVGATARPALVARDCRRRPGPRRGRKPRWRRSARRVLTAARSDEADDCGRLLPRPTCSSGRRSTRRSGWRCSKRRRAALPVVAGASGGVADIVARAKPASWSPPGDAAAFAAAVRAAYPEYDCARRNGSGSAARRSSASTILPVAAARLAALDRAGSLAGCGRHDRIGPLLRPASARHRTPAARVAHRRGAGAGRHRGDAGQRRRAGRAARNRGDPLVQLPPVRGDATRASSWSTAPARPIDDRLAPGAAAPALARGLRRWPGRTRVIIEGYPFARRAFRFELEPLIAAVRAAQPRPRLHLLGARHRRDARRPPAPPRHRRARAARFRRGAGAWRCRASSRSRQVSRRRRRSPTG